MAARKLSINLLEIQGKFLKEEKFFFIRLIFEDFLKKLRIFVSDVLQGPAFGMLIAGDKVLEINGISMEKAEKPQATDLLKRSKTATFKVARRVPTNMSTMMGPPMGQMPVQMQQYQTMMQNSY
jgi:hypothetical protein